VRRLSPLSASFQLAPRTMASRFRLTHELSQLLRQPVLVPDLVRRRSLFLRLCAQWLETAACHAGGAVCT
jgi:hypothetical protein